MRLEHTISGSGSATAAVPTNNRLQGGAHGKLLGVELRLAVGASVTSVTPLVYEGQREANPTVPDEQVLYEGSAITSGLSASATDRIGSRTFLTDPEPFSDGLTPAVTVAATGAWTIVFTTLVDLDTYEAA